MRHQATLQKLKAIGKINDMEKTIKVVFTDGTSPKNLIKLPDGYDMKKLPAWLANKYPDKTVATVDGQPLVAQAASVTEPELTADDAGKKTGQTIKDIGIGTWDAVSDVADKTWRFGKGVAKGIAGYDESVKAQDDAVLERIKSIKY
jgi:hypothetical protein